MVHNSIYLIIIIFTIIINVNSSFLVLPLRSLKRKNIDLPFDMPGISKYLLKNYTIEILLDEWRDQITFIDILVGNPELRMKMEMTTEKSRLTCRIDPKYQKEDNINYFRITQSYYNVTEIKIVKTYSVISMTGCGYDYFQFLTAENLNDAIYKEKNISLEHCLTAQFYEYHLINVNNYTLKDFNVTFNFLFGLGDNFLLSTLKQKELFDSYDFKFDFYKNPNISIEEEDDEIGRIIFGKFEKIYNKKKYPEKNLKVTKLVQQEQYKNTYAVGLTEIFIQKTGKNKQTISSLTYGEFKFNQNFFESNRAFCNKIEEEFFNKHSDLCEKKLVFSGAEYAVFVCNKNIKNYKNEFPTLKMYIDDLKFTFEFNYDDLFREFDDKEYFMIIYDLGSASSSTWKLGMIFLKKYELFFNSDSKELKFYYESKEKKPKKSKAGKIFLIIGDIVLIGVLFVVGYYLGKKLNQKRKLRAHELEDNYDYAREKNYKNVELN